MDVRDKSWKVSSEESPEKEVLLEVTRGIDAILAHLRKLTYKSKLTPEVKKILGEASPKLYEVQDLYEAAAKKQP